MSNLPNANTNKSTNDSPNTSTLTISPLISNKRSKDYFVTPPNAASSFAQSRIISTPSTFKHNNDSLTDLGSTKGGIPSSVYQINSSMDEPTGVGKERNTQVKNEKAGDLPRGGESQHNVDNQDNDDIPLSQADKLRLWRHDALMQHHHNTAIYIGDKVLALTNDPNDAFWLAQVHYSNGNYHTAKNLLSGPKFENSVSCRYLAGLSLFKLELWDEALDMIGEVNPFKTSHSIKNPDGGIKLEASMCYLRGQIYAKQNNFERAKESYKEAVLVDVKCYEAFNELITNYLLSPEEEWEFISLLNFDDADNNNELVKLLYTTRLSKYKNINLFEDAEQRLRDEYNLSDNTDVLLSRADLLLIQCKFQQCMDICEKIIERDELNLSCLPNYLTCLHELGSKNKLFLIAHKLAENYPNHYITWLAIGVYYFSIKKTNDARLFFSKSSLINPNFSPAWIGFAHTFAAEGEHEQAISAYATAVRLFPGIHLPNLYLGMQYLQMNNFTLAGEYLVASYSICNSDPLLLNEIGVLNYHQGNLARAETFFMQALAISRNFDSDFKSWISVHCNLGHVYRRLEKLDKSLEHFEKVLRVNSKDVNVYSAVGLIYLKMRKYNKAIETLHIALSLSPGDPVAADLLKRALEINFKITSRNFFQETDNLTKLNEQTFRYKIDQMAAKGNKNGANRVSGLSAASLNTPVSKSTNIINLIGQNRRDNGNSNNLRDVDILVEDLRRGEDSSDGEEEAMELESD